MASNTGILGSSKTASDPAAEKLGCYRVWVRPKTSRKETRKRGHILLGPYALDPRK
jgi:hypothetical protein